MDFEKHEDDKELAEKIFEIIRKFHVMKIVLSKTRVVKASVGVNKPGVYGDKPSFY